MGHDELPQPGDVLAMRYAIEGVIARGGMGVVYEARDLDLQRPVALKLLPPFTRAQQAHERFLRECKLTASVNHPNVIPIFDAGFHHDRLPFFVMERLHGSTVKRATRAGPLSVRAALRITMGVCAALSAAHERGVLHRDVKPANVFLTAPPHENVVLFDFGLSLDVARETRLTDRGVVVGTPAYLAPETVVGRDADVRADVYGVGTVAYRALVARRHIAPDVEAVDKVLDAILGQRPTPLRELRAEIPAAVAELVERSLAKRPEDRFQTALEMQLAAEAALASLPP